MGNLTFAPAALLHLIGFCLLLKVRQRSAGQVRYWLILALSFTEFAYSACILMYRFLPFHAHIYIISNSVLLLMYASLMHLVLFDRFLEIYLHLRYETICTVERTKKLLLSIMLFLVISSIPQLVLLEKSIPSIFKFYMNYFWSTASISFLIFSVAVYGYIYVKLRRSRCSRIHVARQPKIRGNAVTDNSMQQQKQQQSAQPDINQAANFSKPRSSIKHSSYSNSCCEDSASKYQQSLHHVCKSHHNIVVTRLADSAIQNGVVLDKVIDDISIKRFDSDTTDYSTTNQVSNTIDQTAENQPNQISGHQRNEPNTITKTKGTPTKLMEITKQLEVAKKKLFLPTLLVASFIVFWISPIIYMFFRLTILFGRASSIEYIFMNTLVVFGICFDAFAYNFSYKPVRRYLRKKLRGRRITNGT